MSARKSGVEAGKLGKIQAQIEFFGCCSEVLIIGGCDRKVNEGALNRE